MAVLPSSTLEQHLTALEQRFSGQLALAAKNLSTGEEILRDPDRTFPTASVFKIPVMIEVFRQVADGSCALEERIPLRAEDVVRGSGVLRDLRAGLEPTIEDLVTLMIIVSDNTATNMLIDRVGGVDAINRTMRELGFPATTVHNRIDFDLIGDDGRRLAVASPRDLARMGELLARGQLITPDASAAMLAILGRQHYLNQVPRYYAYNPYGPELGVPQTIWIGCKTGALPGMRADAGVVRLPGDVTFVYAVMNEGSRDTGFTNENESEIVNGAVGRLLLEHWWPADSESPMPVVESPYVSSLLGRN